MTGEWANKAACLGRGSELFFSVEADDQRTAREICATCPVQGECRDWAITTKEPDGIWGGLDDEERRSVRRKALRQRRQDRLDQKRYEQRRCEECGTTFTVTREQRATCGSKACKRARKLRQSALSSRRARYRQSA